MAGVAAASIAHLYLDSTLRDELNAQANAPSVEAGELALIAGAPSAESSSRLPDLSDALSTTAAFTRQAVEATRDGTLKAGAAVRPAMVATRQTTSALVEATRERTRKGLQTAKDATASGFQTAKDVMAPAAAAVEPAWDVMAPAIAPAASTVWNATKEGTRRSLDATRKGLDATRVAGGAVAGQLEPVLTATREADLSRLITATRDQTRRGLAKARSLSYDDLADLAEGATNNTRDALTATLATSLDVAVDIDNKLGEIVFDGADRAGSVARRAWSSLQLENLALPDSFALDSLGSLPSFLSMGDGGSSSSSASRGPTMSMAQALKTLQSSHCGWNNDVKLRPFASAIQPFVAALEVLGPWTHFAARETKVNLAKIENSAAVAELIASGEREPTLHAVLQKEVAANIHPPGSLADESAAMGCVWLLRFLSMFCFMWNEPRPRSFKEAVDNGYKVHIMEYHNWILQQTFFLATAVVPSWQEATLKYAAFDVEGEEGVIRGVEQLKLTIARVEEQLKATGLWRDVKADKVT